MIEATGAAALVFAAMRGTAPYGITCLTGVSPRGRTIRVDAGELNRDIVLENDAVVGSVNANLRHYAQAAEALAAADLDWLGGWSAGGSRSRLRGRVRAAGPTT